MPFNARRQTNKISRRQAAAIMAEWDCDTPMPVESATGGIIYRVVVNTQVYENYGAHAWDGVSPCPQYWKAKGGSEYQREVGDISTVLALGARGIQQIADEIREECESDTESWREYAIDWNLYASNEETYDEQLEREIREMYPPLPHN